ncbi:hypothetical protein F5J12DRAFT_924885 [Pisolithus orientalis]|uniref:uncharacterized protein n=1 Tax=Pisolithus orientalis TaxID=936130 RepID=UPI002224E768|nr:uncharacterized protein F5J12DRAFT_924885 [Pisolithus orientalis]KAI6030467.1 hypothetical protein F5J12DRAFT_924885 [Pisolithus orientalis]
MKSSVADTLIFTDPLLGIFCMFRELDNLSVSTSLSVVPFDDFSHRVAEHTSRRASQLVLLPWLLPTSNYQTTMDAEATPTTPKSPRFEKNPFEAFFGSLSRADKSASDELAVPPYSQHVLPPFFGGPDDRLSLEFVVQLCLNPRITATVASGPRVSMEQIPALQALVHRGDTLSLRSTAFPDTVYGQLNTQTRMQSETADSMTWSKYASLNPDPDTPSLLRAALSRTRFSEFSMPTPLRTAIQRAATIGQTHTRLMIVAGRSKRLATESHHHELKEIFVEYGTSGEMMRKTIGDVASAMVVSNSASALVVLQTAIPVEFKERAV